VFNRVPKDESHPLDEPIDNLTRSLAGMTEGEEVHTQAVASLKILMELRNADKAEKRKPPVSPEVVVAAGAHILGIAMILGFEQRHVLTSKAMAFVPKIRI
jgi:hypothetical protein